MLADIPIVTDRDNKRGKIKIWVCSLRRNGLAILFCVFTVCLVVFSNTNLTAARDGLILWATAVVPSLFPFFVATEMLSYTNVVSVLGKWLNPIMRPLFGVPGEASFAFLMGLISGYPVGAKIVSNFMEQGICTKEEAERMLAFTNNSGPLFIIGTVGITLFGNSSIGILLFVTHVLACISVGIILNLLSSKKRLSSNRNSFTTNNEHFKSHRATLNRSTSTASPSTPSFSALGEILGNSIKNATSTVLMIGGFVVIFSVVISILNQSHVLDAISNILAPMLSITDIPIELIKPILSGIVELTNGVSLVADASATNFTCIVTCAFLLGFGGFSVLLQVFSIVSKNSLSIKKYAIGKLMQGILAAIYTSIALQFIPLI